MNEDFVTIEIAKKLHENGFNEPCINAINPYGCTYLNGWCEYLDNRDGEHITQKDLKKGCYLLPTISQVLKWLREEKETHISIDIWGKTWGYDILNLPSGNSLHWTAYREDIKSYEDAALDGIKYALDNLI